MRFRVARIVGLALASFSCAAPADRTRDTATTPPVAWTTSIDRAAKRIAPYEFTFPMTDSEDCIGRLFRLPDSSTRVDIERSDSSSRTVERFYGRGIALRVAVWSEQRDRSGAPRRVARTVADSTWFEGRDAVGWKDSLGRTHIERDSALHAHGAEVRAEYLWALHMAGTMPIGRGSAAEREPTNVRPRDDSGAGRPSGSRRGGI